MPSKNRFNENWKLRPIYAQALLFADDILLIADTEQKLQNMITEWARYIESKGMALNPYRSKVPVMVVAKQQSAGRTVNISCKEAEFQLVSQYSYLGAIISSDGRIDNEIMNRVQKSTIAFYTIYQTIFGKKEVENNTKIRIYNTVIQPILTYECESWTSQQKHLSKVNAVEMKVLRISGKTRQE